MQDEETRGNSGKRAGSVEGVPGCQDWFLIIEIDIGLRKDDLSPLLLPLYFHDLEANRVDTLLGVGLKELKLDASGDAGR